MLRVRFPFRHIVLCTLLAAGLFLASFQASHSSGFALAQDGPGVIVHDPVAPDVFIGDVKSLPSGIGNSTIDIPEGGPEPPPIAIPRKKLASGSPDPALQSEFDASRSHGSLSGPIQNFEGMFVGEGGPSVPISPRVPDTVGDVGPNHYVQMVNSAFKIYDRQGNTLAGPFAINSLWATLGGPCETRNDGDPIVLYDHLADRWLLSQFVATGPPFGMCIAISRGPNPVTDGFFLYTFLLPAAQGTFPDYPKFGVWPDAYYMSTFEGAVLGPYAFDRANMLTGGLAGAIEIIAKSASLIPAAGFRETRILPAELDGQTPPAGSPNYFVRTVETQQDFPTFPADRVEIFEFRANWAAPAASTFTLVQTLTPLNYAMVPCAPNVRDCIPQPGVGLTMLDALSNRPMMHLKYRNFGTHESMVVNQTVDADGRGNAGIRWYELRRTPPGSGAWTIHQQGTFAIQQPGVNDTTWVHRWMGSMAIDNAGNIALGYSVVNADVANPVFPGIRYTGRLASDPLGLLPQGEETIINGLAARDDAGFPMPLPNPRRWGDYSSLSIDPVDDCTFWYTNQYIRADGNWNTRIASFRFASCNPDLSITKIDSPDPVLAGDNLTYNLTVTNSGPRDAVGVIVTDTLPAGVTFVSATPSQGGCTEAAGVVTCDLDTLADGASATIAIDVTVNSSTSCGSTLTNTAEVLSSEPDPNIGNNAASADTTVNCAADLSITKSASPARVVAGDNITYTLTVKNNGPSDATEVTVTDTLPAGVTVVSATPSQGSCTGVICNLGDLPSGAIATITIVVTVDPAAPSGPITNTAVVTGNEMDPDTTNNEASADTMILGACTILDDFNRPDGPLGSNWAGRLSGYRINDHHGVVRTYGLIYWQPESYGPDQETCITLTRINPKSRQHGILLKAQELNNWRKGAILVGYNARSGIVDVKARDVGNHKWNLIGSFTPLVPVVDGDQLRAQAWADGTVEVFINDISIGTADAGSFYVDKGGQIGLWFRGGQVGNDDNDDKDEDILLQEELQDEKITGRRAFFDDFGGGNLTPP